ncbi:MAG: ATP-binding protein, partial [Chloroflexia bacterium]|nr:ATP-binding protein [Chloroflexia bacterium]
MKIAIEKNIGDDFWNGIVEILGANTKISNSILTHLFQSVTFRERCYSYLGENQVVFDEKLQKDRFIKIWNDKINSIRSLKNSWFLSLDSIVNSKTSESFVENFNKTAYPVPKWISQIDSIRINSMNEIVKSISEFISQNAFEDKERFYNIVINQSSQLKLEIEESPTELSFNVIRKLLSKIENLILTDYNQLVLTSKPEISISILGECVLHELDFTVNMQISISNKKGSAPVSSLELSIQDSEDIKFIPTNNVLEQTLKGGDEKILRLQVAVNEKIKEEGAANILITSKYKVRGIEEINSFSDNLTLRLYSEKEFLKINNPFAATADSGPVTDPNMFFGRGIFIENIRDSILDSASKCIIIYGQKRSGKSSVLYHLKEMLINDNDAFCVSFSLGEIVENLSSLTFYYKVLSEMEDALEDMKENGMEVPEFSAPSLTELKEAPSLVFNECLKKFNKDIRQYENWGHKKLILLLDEFTYIYTAIQKKVLSDDFMKTWKSFLEKGFFTSVLVGQDIMPKFTESFPNEFGVTEPKRLSYLDKEDAISLIEKPIWDDEKQRSRFLGNSVNFILDYTSSNPYYIQIFCARFVDYMNYKKYVSVTEADIIDVAQTFIKGE